RREREPATREYRRKRNPARRSRPDAADGGEFYPTRTRRNAGRGRGASVVFSFAAVGLRDRARAVGDWRILRVAHAGRGWLVCDTRPLAEQRNHGKRYFSEELCNATNQQTFDLRSRPCVRSGNAVCDPSARRRQGAIFAGEI